jgi:hypothetical protein
MLDSSPVSASGIDRTTSIPNPDVVTAELDQQERIPLLRNRLTRFKTGLRYVEELRREAAKLNLQARSWVAAQIIQDVPSDIALCEFACRKIQCSSAEWATCARRLGLEARLSAKTRIE